MLSEDKYNFLFPISSLALSTDSITDKGENHILIWVPFKASGNFFSGRSWALTWAGFKFKRSAERYLQYLCSLPARNLRGIVADSGGSSAARLGLRSSEGVSCLVVSCCACCSPFAFLWLDVTTVLATKICAAAAVFYALGMISS